MEQDELETRNKLKDQYQSFSSKNIIAVEATQEKIIRWLKHMQKNRPAQTILLSMLTDTSFKINGSRLKCPTCPTNTKLTLEHILKECPEIEMERIEAFYGTPKTTGTDDDWSKTLLLPNLCMAGRTKIQGILRTSREEFLKMNNIISQ